MIVRWLGAFDRGPSLEESLVFELTRDRNQWVCATTHLLLRCGESRPIASVGLLVPTSAVVKRWKSDVWSVPTIAGKLYRTAPNFGNGYHDEIWVKPIYTAVVVHPCASSHSIKTSSRIAREYGLRVITLNPSQSANKYGETCEGNPGYWLDRRNKINWYKARRASMDT